VSTTWYVRVYLGATMTVRYINICLLGRSGIRNDLQTVVEELVAALERVGVTLGAVCQGETKR